MRSRSTGERRAGKVNPRDRVYVTNIVGDVLRVVGAFTMGKATRAAKRHPPCVAWEAREHLWPEDGSPTEFGFRAATLEVVGR